MHEINHNGLSEFELVLLNRELSESILPGLFEYSSDSRLYEFMCELDVHKNISDSVQYLDKLLNRIDEQDYIYWVIFNNKKKAIGTVGIKVENNKSEISYAISPEYWGTNCVFYMLYCIFYYLINNTKIDTVEAVMQADNRSALHILKLSGFSIYQHVKNYYNCLDGGKIDALKVKASKKDINLNRIKVFVRLLDNNMNKLR
jgi:RimJ/RimL family protein N-acetyltransferase